MQGTEQLVDYSFGLLLIAVDGALALHDVGDELAARAQLHHEVQVLLVVVGLEVLDDVGMVYLPEEVNLIHDVS